MSSIDRIANISVDYLAIQANTQALALELLIAHGASKEDYLVKTLKEAIRLLPESERMSVAIAAAPLFATAHESRDYRDILDIVYRVPQESRELLIEQTARLLQLSDTPLVSVVLEALCSVNFDERDDVVRHVQAFLSGHQIRQFDISDAIYALVKIPPKNRLALIENTTLLTRQMKSGVWRCTVLTEMNKVALQDQYDVVKHVLSLIDHIGAIDDREYGNLVDAVAQIPAHMRFEVIESVKPLLSGLTSFYIKNLLMAIAEIDKDDREAVINQLLALAMLTPSGFFRGQLLLALSQQPNEQRELVIGKAMPFLREEIWWCNSVDNFIRIAAVTPTEELAELHAQVKVFLANERGGTVEVLMACARAARPERQALLDDVKPLVVGDVNLLELAAIMGQALPMQRQERQQLIRDTLRVLRHDCSTDRLRLFQVVRDIPARFREAVLRSIPNPNEGRYYKKK